MSNDLNTSAIVPVARTPVSIRPATLDDIPFMDGLQKKYGKALGYFPTKQFQEYVQTGGVLIAEGDGVNRLTSRSSGNPQDCGLSEDSPSVTQSSVLSTQSLGYVISRDRYLKRDELGVVYQLCVAPGVQRKLVGAALVREVFERSAYGCRLYCCWCAQDLDANYFWESLGFVPIAFRAGSAKRRSARGQKGRVHIFWQKRIGAGDEVTPYWYPFQTSSGAIREDRLVFPIPPGVHWKEVQAVSVPRARTEDSGLRTELEKAKPRALHEKNARTQSSVLNAQSLGSGKVAILVGGRIKYVGRPGYVAPQATSEPAPALLPALPAPRAIRTRVPRPKAPAERIDPKYLAAARELRDRYLEHLNGEQFNSGMILPGGKYAIERALPGAERERLALPQAA